MTTTLTAYWDVGEDLTGQRCPNLGKTSTARVMQALLLSGGKLVDADVSGEECDPLHLRCVLYRITLPLGSEAMFEELSGYTLTLVDTIEGS
jgi:hypothetical protein